MFQPDPGTIVVLTKLDATYCFRHVAATPAIKEFGEVVQRAVPGRIICDIIDKATRVAYVHAEGDSEPEALINAVKAACSADKPKTPAQAATAHAAELSKLVGSKNEEIDALKAEVAKLKADKSATKSRVTKDDNLPAGLIGAEKV